MTLTARPTPTIDTDTQQPGRADTARVLPELVELHPAQVAQHPDNLRDPGRDLKALTASVAEVGVLVPLIVVPIDAVPGEHDWPAGTTHVAIRRQPPPSRRRSGRAAPALRHPPRPGDRPRRRPHDGRHRPGPRRTDHRRGSPTQPAPWPTYA